MNKYYNNNLTNPQCYLTGWLTRNERTIGKNLSEYWDKYLFTTSQGYLLHNDSVEYWTGSYSTEGNSSVGSIKWRDQRHARDPLPGGCLPPPSGAICVYPPGNNYWAGKPMITVTVIDAHNHSRFATAVKQDIPLKAARFEEPVEIQFSYLSGKYKYASECFTLTLLMVTVEDCIGRRRFFNTTDYEL